ncbi:MAG: hypothetical protein ACK4YP_26370, partial [Myxococcota bacterium]
MPSNLASRAVRAANDPGRIDLHMHTDRSDGRFPPEDVLARALADRYDTAVEETRSTDTPRADEA